MLPVIEKLLQKGFSKYRIAQCCGVSWATVWNWVNGFYAPNQQNATALLALLNNNEKLPTKKIKLIYKKKNKNNEGSMLIEKLLKSGYSKYALAKYCKVKWNTVQCWAKGIYNPSEERLNLLKTLKTTEVTHFNNC